MPFLGAIIKIRKPIHEVVLFTNYGKIYSFGPSGYVSATDGCRTFGLKTKKVEASLDEERDFLREEMPRIIDKYEGKYFPPNRVCFHYSNDVMRHASKYLNRPNKKLVGDYLAHGLTGTAIGTLATILQPSITASMLVGVCSKIVLDRLKAKLTR